MLYNLKSPPIELFILVCTMVGIYVESGRGILGVDLIGGREENIRGEMKDNINWLRLWIENKNQPNARLVKASFHIESNIVSNQ